MTTDTLTLPRRALVQRDEPKRPRRLMTETDLDPAPRRAKTAGPTRPIRVRTRRSRPERRPVADQLLLVGPTGGPLWTFLAR